MKSDPIADYLTRVRNALMAKHKSVDIPASNMKIALTRILEDNGYIAGHEVIADAKQGIVRIALKYVDGKPAITSLQRVSKPGIRRYSGARTLPRVKNGFGIGIVSTPNGILSDKEARARNAGGEILCYIW